VIYQISKTFCVHKNDSLGVIIERVENIHDEIYFLALLALVIELLNIF
jgi:hypothetical protein